MKYNDYIYGFTLNNTNFQVSLRVQIEKELKSGEIFKIIIKDAVRNAIENGFNNTQEKDILFNFITLVNYER